MRTFAGDFIKFDFYGDFYFGIRTSRLGRFFNNNGTQYPWYTDKHPLFNQISTCNMRTELILYL